MSEKIDDGGPAFPHGNLELGDRHLIAQPGMSLRDWFAGQALIGLISNSQGVPSDFVRANSNEADRMAEISYRVADTMLKARLP